jgi:hypothetical protein
VQAVYLTKRSAESIAVGTPQFLKPRYPACKLFGFAVAGIGCTRMMRWFNELISRPL